MSYDLWLLLSPQQIWSSLHRWNSGVKVPRWFHQLVRVLFFICMPSFFIILSDLLLYWILTFSVFFLVVVNIIWWMVMISAVGLGRFIILWFLAAVSIFVHLILCLNLNIHVVVVLLPHRCRSPEPLSSKAHHPHLPDSFGGGQPPLSFSDLHQKRLGWWRCLHPELGLHDHHVHFHFPLVHFRWE